MGNSGKITAVCLQVRIESSRLPGKALIDLEGRTVIEHAMAALKLVPADYYLLVTEAKSGPALKPYADAWGFETFIGPEDDVLKRYVLAAREYRAETVIRATGDNPLVSPKLARDILEAHRDRCADYSGFLGMPLGLGVEAVEAAALETADRAAEGGYDREHVCPYLYSHQDRFVLHRPKAAEEYLLGEGRVTLDTEDDLQLLKRIFRDLYRGGPVEADAVVRWLKEYTGAVLHNSA